MKHTYIKMISAALLCFSSLGTYAASENTILSAKVIDEKTVQVTLARPIDASSLTGDIKLLKDVSVASAVKSLQNEKVVNITLSGELMSDTSYSLLSIFGAEGNIDFTLKKEFNNVEFINTDTDNTFIEKVIVKDTKNIDVYYKAALKSESVEYKILANLGVDSIGKDIKNTSGMLLTTKSSIEKNTAYILTIVSLKDIAGEEITFSEGLFDFTSGEFQATSTGSTIQATQTGQQLPELNAAAVITEDQTGAQVEKQLIEEVALGANETPDTGAETWVILLGTLIINTIYGFSRRKKSLSV